MKPLEVKCDCGKVMKNTEEWKSGIPSWSMGYTYFCKNCNVVVHVKIGDGS